MEKSVFLKKIERFIQKHDLLPANANIIVAISGGADSVALLITLHSLGYNLVAAHCNFNLRGEDSVNDEKFVTTLTDSLGIKLRVIHFDVPAYEKSHHLSTEMACRELRYEWFEKLRVEENCTHIAVGHHQDDNIETFFLNILRGTGINGLSAIKPKNNTIIRPLLDVSRREIEDFLSTTNQAYVTDYTNNQSDFKRNKLRNIILPDIKSEFQGAETAILRTIDNITSCNEYYQASIKRDIKSITHYSNSGIKININSLLKFEGSNALLFEILKEYGFNSTQSTDMHSICTSDNSTGKQFFSATHVATFNRGNIEIAVLNKAEDNETSYNFTLDSIPENLPLNLISEILTPNDSFQFERNSKIAYFNNSLLGKQITLRKWKEGDRFTPFGMKGNKKLSDLFTDMKISLYDKQKIYVLTVNDKIIWVIGLRASNLFRCNSKLDNPIIKVSLK